MAQALPTSPEADDLQRQMRAVRVELRNDVQQLVDTAHTMGDWKKYVKAYPWLCVAAAAAVGYFVIPARPLVVHPNPETLFKLAREHKLVMTPDDEPPRKKQGGLVAQLLSMAAAAALQGGIRIATSQLSAALSSAGKSQSNGRPGVPHA